MENKQPQGFLFDSIAFYSEESVEAMIDNLNKDKVRFEYSCNSMDKTKLEEDKLLILVKIKRNLVPFSTVNLF